MNETDRIPRSGTWARAEHNLAAAFDAVLSDDRQEKLFRAGETLFAGEPLPAQQRSWPAATFFAGSPGFTEHYLGRDEARTLYAYEITVFARARTELIDVVDALATALRAAQFRVSFVGGEGRLDDHSAVFLPLVAEAR